MTFGPYHLQDGLFFQKLEDGHVRITVTTDLCPPKSNGHNVEFTTVITRPALASVMASMSQRGETSATFDQALIFLKLVR